MTRPSLRTCTKCGIVAYHYAGSSKCMKCCKAYAKAYYRKNKATRIKQIADYDKRTNRKH